MPRAPLTPLRLWIATSLLACQAEVETPAQAPVPAPAAAAPWHYAPALRAGTPAGVAASPVFELADGRLGEATIAVAVARAGAPPRLELWRFSQNNPRERLERASEVRELRALDGSGGRDELVTMYRAIAQPGNEYVRPRGLSGPPEALFPELVRLAGVVRDPGAAPEERAAALADLTFALDDHLFFERDLLPSLLAALATGDWTIAEREPLGERRVRVVLRAGHRFTAARTGDRWVLSEAELVLQAGRP